MSSELKPTPLRTIDQAQLRKNLAALEARRAVLIEHGQKLLARIRPSSKYYGQGQEDALFAVCIGPGGGVQRKRGHPHHACGRMNNL